MKLSAKKRGQIYDLVHSTIMDLRVDIQTNYFSPAGLVRPEVGMKIDYKIAQTEIPLAQKIMKLLDKDYK